MEGLDCLGLFCVRDVSVNDIITFDHSSEIEVALSKEIRFVLINKCFQYLGTSKRCSCGAANCKKVLGRQAHTRGPAKCGACAAKVVEQGAVGVVTLHPELATPLCRGCHDNYCR